jgi:hypothetical protein
VVPVPRYRRYADILNAATREFPIVDIDGTIEMTPGQQHRARVRRRLP